MAYCRRCFLQYCRISCAHQPRNPKPKLLHRLGQAFPLNPCTERVQGLAQNGFKALHRTGLRYEGLGSGQERFRTRYFWQPALFLAAPVCYVLHLSHFGSGSVGLAGELGAREVWFVGDCPSLFPVLRSPCILETAALSTLDTCRNTAPLPPISPQPPAPHPLPHPLYSYVFLQRIGVTSKW